MKTRIKVKTYENGNKEYIAQEKLPFLMHVKMGFDEFPLFFIAFSLLFIPLCFLFQFFWGRVVVFDDKNHENVEVFKTIEEAKYAIDLKLASIEQARLDKIAAKKAKKIVKTEYLDYP